MGLHQSVLTKEALKWKIMIYNKLWTIKPAIHMHIKREHWSWLW